MSADRHSGARAPPASPEPMSAGPAAIDHRPVFIGSGPAPLGPPGTTFSPIVPPRVVHSGLAEAGRLLFAAEAHFIAGASGPSALPPEGLPEIAFVGRSNVGKSSLVNALTGRRTLARISNTPGRTRQINFFRLGGQLMLADLPGYGYARVSKADSDRWTALVFSYLQGRPSLRRAVH